MPFIATLKRTRWQGQTDIFQIMSSPRQQLDFRFNCRPTAQASQNNSKLAAQASYDMWRSMTKGNMLLILGNRDCDRIRKFNLYPSF